MSMLRMIPFLAVLFFVNAGLAQDQIGEINCNVLDNETLGVTASIVGTKNANESKVQSANVVLSTYNPKTKTSKTLKAWKNVPYVDHGVSFSVEFKNQQVSLKAYFDDVGSMSELSYEGKTYQLQCDVDLD